MPDVEDPFIDQNVRILPLESLVKMKLTSVPGQGSHTLHDMIDVGLIDGSWCSELR